MRTTRDLTRKPLPHPFAVAFVFLVLLALAPGVHAIDWPAAGRDATGNAASPEHDPPTLWRYDLDRQGRVVNTSPNIKWAAKIGDFTLSTPVISRGLVWVGANNADPRDPSFREDASVLMCFRESDGKFLWQFAVPHRKTMVSYSAEWNHTPMACSPVFEDNLMWFFTPAGEVRCFDIGGLLRGRGTPKEVWKLDLISQLGVHAPRSMYGWATSKSMSAPYKDWIYLITGNGVDCTATHIPAPDAPSLVCLEKTTGKVVWTDDSPGTNIFYGQVSSPLVLKVAGRVRVFAGLGDGKLRCYDPRNGRILWTYDANPPESRRKEHQYRFHRPDGPSEIVAPPVFYKNRIYVVLGQDPEFGDGDGQLSCLDAATGRLLWRNREIHRSLCPVIVDGHDLYAVDFSGLVYGLSADTGRVRWKFDAGSRVWAAPLLVDQTLYVGDQDGEMTVFDLGEIDRGVGENATAFTFTKKTLVDAPASGRAGGKNGGARVLVRGIPLPEPIFSAPVFANGVLYVNTQSHLVAVSSANGRY